MTIKVLNNETINFCRWQFAGNCIPWLRFKNVSIRCVVSTSLNPINFDLSLFVSSRSPSERSGKGCCGQWFAGPPIRAVIAVVALGGVACALGGAALGATGLAGPPTSHLMAALLMIGKFESWMTFDDTHTFSWTIETKMRSELAFVCVILLNFNAKAHYERY